MPFTSAHLKVVYEYLRASGTSLSASEIARLFRAGQLGKLLEAALRRQRQIRLCRRGISLAQDMLARTDLPQMAIDYYQMLLASYEDQLEGWIHKVDEQERWH